MRPLTQANGDSLTRTPIHKGSFNAIALLFACLYSVATAAAPAYTLITSPPGHHDSSSLAQKLAKWRQQGLVADAQLLSNDEAASETFSWLGVLEFASETDQADWQESEAPGLDPSLNITPVTVMAHGEKTPRNSLESVFLVSQYEVKVPDDVFQEYTRGYVEPQMQAWMAAQNINRYTSYYAPGNDDAPWQCVLLMEYRNPHALAMRDEVKAAARVELNANNEVFRHYTEIKQSIRAETALTRFMWRELPPPDLSDLPDYQPQANLHGSLRILGSELKNAVDLLADGFGHYHPDVKTSTNHIPSSEGAIAGLYLGVSDVAPMGDDAKITDLMPYYNTFRHLPVEISVATGGYEKRGSLFAWAIAVNRDNPLQSISVDQLKRVFGGERNGGWEISHNNYKFTARHRMGREELIRSWDQLGLGGEFAGKEIHTFGYAAPGFSTAIERSWFHWSKKWNANFLEYVEAKQTTPDEAGFAVASERALEDLESNPYAIGIVALMHAKHYPNIKILPIAPQDGTEPVALTPKNVATRRYPLIRDAYFYVNKPPGRAMDPIVREFMRYCLSRQGQEAIVKAGYYYPLSREYLVEQLAKLD